MEQIQRRTVTADDLPDDLLMQVFLAARDHRVAKDGSSRVVSWARCGEVVSKVNRRWRKVSIDQAALWTDLIFNMREGPPFEKSDLYIERSKNLPLHIRLLIVPFYAEWFQGRDLDNFEAEDVEEDWYDFMWELKDVLEVEDFATNAFMYWCSYTNWVLDLVIPHSRRWGSFYVDVMPRGKYEALFCVILSRLSSLPAPPVLESFSLVNVGSSPGRTAGTEFQPAGLRDYYSRAAPFGGRIPALKQLKLQGVHISWSGLHVFPQLTCLVLSSQATDVRPSWDDFMRILEGCAPSLEILILESGGPHGLADIRAGETITLPRVHRVVFSHMTPTEATALWQRLHLPVLRRLTLSMDFMNNNYTQFIEFVCSEPDSGGSNSKLPPKTTLEKVESLTLNALICDDVVVPKLFSRLPYLRKLSLYKVKYGPIMSALTTFRDPDTGNVWTGDDKYPSDPQPKVDFHCPLLREITMKAPLETIGELNLADFAHARNSWAKGYTIQKMTLDLHDVWRDTVEGAMDCINLNVKDEVGELIMVKNNRLGANYDIQSLL